MVVEIETDEKGDKMQSKVKIKYTSSENYKWSGGYEQNEYLFESHL